MSLLIPDPILLEICGYLIDYDILSFLSSDKYLHKLKHLTWFDSSIRFKKIRKISYKDRFRSIIIKISEIKYLTDRPCKDYYDSEKNIYLPNLRKLTIIIDIRACISFNEILIDKDTAILNKLNIKILILILDVLPLSNRGHNVYSVASKLPDSIVKFEAPNGIICKTKFLPKYLTELNVRTLDNKLLHSSANNFSIFLEKISCLNFPLNSSFKVLKEINFYDNITYPSHIFIPHGITQIKNMPRLQNILIPPTVKKLSFAYNFNEEIKVESLPNNLIKLKFSYLFNQELSCKSLPSSLKKLILSNAFDKKICKDVLPDTLEYLNLGFDFNQTLHIPSSVKYIKFGYNFNQKLNDVLPVTLESLILCEKYTKSYSFLKSLTNLKRLEMYIQNDNFEIPKSVTHLTIHSNFNADTLKYISSTINLKKLTIAYPKNTTITKYVPSYITYLSLMYQNDEEDLINNIPSTVRILKIYNWSQGLQYKLPLFLTELKLSSTIFDRRFIPRNIKRLKVSEKYKYLISKRMRMDIHISYYK